MSDVKFEFEDLGMLGETISVQRMTGGDKVYLRITKFYKDKETGELKPSKQGISIPEEHVAQLTDLLKTW